MIIYSFQSPFFSPLFWTTELTLSLQTSEGYRNCIVWASQAHMYFTASEAIWRSPITKVTLPYVWEDMLGPLEPLKSLKFAIQRHLIMLGFYWICHYVQCL